MEHGLETIIKFSLPQASVTSPQKKTVLSSSCTSSGNRQGIVKEQFKDLIGLFSDSWVWQHPL